MEHRNKMFDKEMDESIYAVRNYFLSLNKDQRRAFKDTIYEIDLFMTYSSRVYDRLYAFSNIFRITIYDEEDKKTVNRYVDVYSEFITLELIKSWEDTEKLLDNNEGDKNGS